MQRKSPFRRCKRQAPPPLLRAQIMLMQQGRCFDCGTRMILGKIVFDHRPPLALRDKGDSANDPNRLVAICTVCDRRKTPRDIKEIARAKRLALKQQDFDERMRDKVPGRAVPSRSQWRKLVRSIGNGLPVHRCEDIAVIESSQMWTCRKASVCRS
jgi:5-methylcytosine-specific restriction endonuclease McrA